MLIGSSDRHHVLRDRWPYVCAFEGSATPNDCSSIVCKVEKKLENHLRHVHPDYRQTSVLYTVKLPTTIARISLARHLQHLAVLDSLVEPDTADVTVGSLEP